MANVYLNQRDAFEEIERILRSGDFKGTIDDIYIKYRELTGDTCDNETILCLQNIWLVVFGPDSLASSDGGDYEDDDDYYSSEEYYSDDY